MASNCCQWLRSEANSRARAHTHTYFCQLFPKPPMRKVGTHRERKRRLSVEVEVGWVRRVPEDPGYIRQGQVADQVGGGSV